MEAILFTGVIHLAKKLMREFYKVKINAGVFEDEITISCNNLVQAANSLNTAGKNLGTLCSELIDSSIFKHINKQGPLLKEGRQVISDMLTWLIRQVQIYEGSWKFVVMWKWKNMKPFFDGLGDQMGFMLLNMLVINSTIELNIMAKYVTTHGTDSYPCQSHFKTLKRNIKDYNRRIKKLQEAEKLREGQLPLGTRILSSSQKHMREAMDMLQTLTEKYTPPAAAFQVLESPTTSASAASSSTSSSTSSSSNSASTSPPLRYSPKSSPADQIRVPKPSPRIRIRQGEFIFTSDSQPRSPSPRTRTHNGQRQFHFTGNHQPRSPSRVTIPRPQNPVREQQEPALTVDSRNNKDVFSYYIKSGNPIRPTRSVLAQINIRIPINIISIYKAQELDLPIEKLESEDPQKVRYISSENRASNWKIMGKTLDVKIYSDSNAHTKPKTLSLFVADTVLDPPIILGQPFLKQSKRNYRNQ